MMNIAKYNCNYLVMLKTVYMKGRYMMKIEGYFHGIKTANEAADSLRSNGFNNAFVDINDNRNDAYWQLGNGLLSSVSFMSSGMGGFQQVPTISYRVVVETRAENVEYAKNLINSLGGIVNKS